MKFRWKEYPNDVKIILSIYSIGFLAGTYTHLKGILIRGFLAFDAPLALNIYWDSLTFLDPLAALLVWIKPKLGISLAVLIMLSNVIINSFVYITYSETVPGMIPMFLFLQSLFATYIFVTAPVVLEKLRKQFSREHAVPVDNKAVYS